MSADFVPTNWPFLQLVSDRMPDAATLFDLIWDSTFEDIIVAFDQERINEIIYRTDYVPRDDPTVSTTQPGNSWEMRQMPIVGYEAQTGWIPETFRSDARQVISKLINEYAEDIREITADGDMIYNVRWESFQNVLHEEFQKVYWRYKGILDEKLTKVTRFQESYGRVFIKPYGIMVIVYEFWIRIWEQLIVGTAAMIAMKLMRATAGTHLFPTAQKTAGVIEGMANLIFHPVRVIGEALGHIKVRAPQVSVKYATKLANLFRKSAGPLGIVKEPTQGDVLTFAATASLIAGVIVGYGAWKTLEWLGVDMPDYSENDVAKAREQFDPEAFGLLRDEGTREGAIIANLLRELDVYKQEIEGEVSATGPVISLKERLEKFKGRVLSVGSKVLTGGFDTGVILNAIAAKVDEMIASQSEVLGAAELPAIDVGGPEPGEMAESVDPTLVWDIVLPEIMDKLAAKMSEGGMTTEEMEALIPDIVNSAMEEKRPEWEAAIESSLLQRYYIVYGEGEGPSYQKASLAAEAISSMMETSDASSFDYERQVSILRESLVDTTDPEMASSINEFIAITEGVIGDIKEYEARVRGMSRGGSVQFAADQETASL